MTAVVVLTSVGAVFVLSNIGRVHSFEPIDCEIFKGPDNVAHIRCIHIRDTNEDSRARKMMADTIRIGPYRDEFRAAAVPNVFDMFKKRVGFSLAEIDTLYPRSITYHRLNIAQNYRNADNPILPSPDVGEDIEFNQGMGYGAELGPFTIAHGTGSSLTLPRGAYQG